MSQESKEAPVNPAQTSQEKMDCHALLEENLRLLRDSVNNKTKLISESNKIQALQTELLTLKAGCRGYRFGRRVLMGVHVVLSVVLGVSGLILWLNHISPPEACLTVIPGLLWLLITTITINDLANQER